jgi:hypothetical protein
MGAFDVGQRGRHFLTRLANSCAMSHGGSRPISPSCRSFCESRNQISGIAAVRFQPLEVHRLPPFSLQKLAFVTFAPLLQ